MALLDLHPFAVSPMADFHRFSAEFQPIPCNNWQLAPIGSWKLLGTCLLACRFTAVHIQPGLIFLATKRHETTQSHCCWISSGVIDWSKRVHFVEEMQSAALSLSHYAWRHTCYATCQQQLMLHPKSSLLPSCKLLPCLLGMPHIPAHSRASKVNRFEY